MPMTGVDLLSLRAGGAAEWIATMKAGGDEESGTYAGQQIRESFGTPRAYFRYWHDSDLRPELVSEHRGRVRYVLERLTPGRPGVFTVGPFGHFDDFHGGHGFRYPSDLNWFTPEALRRGIGWFFEQTYHHGSDVLARFRVARIISSRDGVRVQKVRIGGG